MTSRCIEPVRLLAAIAVAVVAAAVVLLAGATSSAQAGLVNAGSFAGPGNGADGLGQPGRAAVRDSDDRLFVADRANDRVQVFDVSGSSVTHVASFGAGVLDAPYGVAVDQDSGAVYVSDGDEVVKFDSALAVLGGFARPAVTGPLAVDPTTGDLLVADPVTDSVRRYTADGTPAGSFDAAGQPGGVFTGLLDVAVNSSGDVVVVDSSGDVIASTPGNSSRVVRYSSTGVHEATIGPVNGPGAVAIDRDDDSVFVAGRFHSYNSNQRPQVTLFGADGSQRSNLDLPAETTWSITAGLAPAGDGSQKTYVITKETFDDGWGSTRGYVIDDVLPPTATIAPATGVSEFAATVHGSIELASPDYPATCRFEFVTAAQHTATGFAGAQTRPCAQGIPAGPGETQVDAQLTGLAPGTTYHVRLVAISGATQGTPSADIAFTTLPADPPTVEMGPPEVTGARGVDLFGTVDGDDRDTSWRFEVAPATGAFVAVDDSEGSNDGAPKSVDATVPALQPNTIYRFRLSATSPAGTTTTDPQLVKTPAVKPYASTLAADNVGETAARLRGEVNPYGLDTTYHFEYGTTTNYGSTTEIASAGDGRETKLVNDALAGLATDTTYHYRIVATNSKGAVHGPDRTFTPVAPAPAQDPADCPNAQIRAEQDAERLPDCRAWEMISPAVKNGNPVPPYGSPLFLSRDGETASLSTKVPFQADATGTVGGGSQAYRAVRGSAGWTSRSLVPPLDPDKGTDPGAAATPFWFNDDLSKTIFVQGSHSMFPGTAAPAGRERALALRDASDWSLKWLTEPAIPDPAGTPTFWVEGGSAGFDRIYFSAIPAAGAGPVRLVAADAGRVAGNALYEFADGVLRPADVLPGGEVAPNGSATQSSLSGYLSRDNRVSSDGRRIVFAAWPAPGSGKPVPLYARVDGQRTVALSRSMLTGQLVSGTFAFASPDGSRVWFVAREQLTEDAPSPSPGVFHLYRFDAGSETVSYEPDMLGDGTSEPLASSVDGTRYAYVRNGRLRVYDNGDRRAVTGPLPFPYSNGGTDAGVIRMNPGGSHVVFQAKGPVNAGAFNDGGGFEQVYVYDVALGELACASCPAPPASPAGDSFIESRANVNFFVQRGPRGVTDDGERIYLETPSALVAGDVNGVTDVYEWTRDRVELLSGGTGSHPSSIHDVSADGETVLIATRNRLLGADFDDVLDAYAVRVGGGFPGDAAPPEGCDVRADGCQGGGAQPRRGEVSSDQARGAGVERPARRVLSVGRPGRVARARAVRTGVLALRVRASGAARVRVVARGRFGERVRTIGRGSVRLAGSRPGVVRVRLSRRARVVLGAGRRIAVSATASSPGARSRVVSFALRGRR